MMEANAYAADVSTDLEDQHDTSQLPSVEELKTDAAHASSVSPKDWGKRKRSVLISGFILLGLIAFIVGLTIGLTTAKENSAITGEGHVNKRPVGDEPLPEPGGAPSQKPTFAPSSSFNARREEIHKFLYEQQISEIGALHASGTPQNRAVGFLAIDDELQMEIPHSATSPGAFSFLQRYAVAVFYYEMGLVNLMSSAPTCGWFRTFTEGVGNSVKIGVTCNDDDQVETIFTPNLGIQGSLPDELGILTNLISLAVYDNPGISGSIPDSLSKLTKLSLLDISNNHLDGSIPSKIGDLTKLEYLALGDNALTGSIPPSLSNLRNLTLLDLKGNALAGDIAVLESLVNLEFLYLEHNRLEQSFDDSTLKNLSNLVHLDVSDNLFAGSLPLHFFEMINLEVLDVMNNHLMAGKLPGGIPENKDLRLLFLSGNSFSGSVPASLRNLKGLNHLDLTGNNFTGAIPDLGSLTSLIYFFVANNAFEPGPIPEFLANMTNLVDLSLKGTQRNGPIPTWIGLLDKLVLLDLDRNDLNGSIPSELGSLSELEFLLLNRNQLSGTLPDELGAALPKLKMLLLDNNTITGSTTFACDTDNDVELFVSDCRGNKPELNCSCCDLCCSDSGPDCNDEEFLAQYDPMWEQSYQRRSFYDFGGQWNFN